MNPFPELRLQVLNRAPIQYQGDYVLYWMIACRRMRWNFSLQRAVDWALELSKPLVILEALRIGYPWAGDRLHRFIIDGMAVSARRLEDAAVLYYPYVEPRADAGKGLLKRLARHACVVVTDDFPAFFLPRMVHRAARSLPVRLETVDSNGLLPMRAADRVFPTAHGFRRFLQAHLPKYLQAFPKPDPLENVNLPRPADLPEGIRKTWPMASEALLKDEPGALSGLDIDHSVAPSDLRGGSDPAEEMLDLFIRRKLNRYAEGRNHPDEDVTSGLSPYLHFGHISAHEVFQAVMDREGWYMDLLGATPTGQKTGWWGVSPDAEAFLDQLVTWRELGFNRCVLSRDYDRYESLPDWALKTLNEHKQDHRDYVYTQEAFERAETHDPLWNAAQTQLLRQGVIHNYLRMLWGKKILEWSPTPRRALNIMIELNNKYALDGRDPNSYSGIFWVFGRYDRPWGPERPIFGKIRYMSSKSTAQKLRLEDYLYRFSP
ncbi:MAG: deoxyribodipyrimidine photolyase [Deltaproteobacteria bacterium]|nr:deoxyribodipyrimidine photolyase [Deltaproteobacteria bacterium]